VAITSSITGSWKTTLTGVALAVAHVSVNGVGWKQMLTAALLAILGTLAQDHKPVAPQGS
jgi:hypothetical protein